MGTAIFGHLIIQQTLLQWCFQSIQREEENKDSGQWQRRALIFYHAINLILIFNFQIIMQGYQLLFSLSLLIPQQIIKTVMSRNRHQFAIYKSQATRNNNELEHINRLYGSGARNSNYKSPTKISQNQNNTAHRHIIIDRAVDSQSNSSNNCKILFKNNQLQRSRSGQYTKWQSPSKLTMCGQSFKSIIEEINQQNQRTCSQLDQDLKRIKSNLNRIDQESTEVQQSSQCQLLSQQIQLLNEQNQELREKNIKLISQKKKLSQQIEQYESLVHREKLKQMTSITHKSSTFDSKNEDLIGTIKKLRSQLEQKQKECQNLRLQNNKLSNVKGMCDRRQVLLTQQKNKFMQKFANLQRQIDIIKLKFQQQLKKQLEKKEVYYRKLIKVKENNYDETISKLQQNFRKSAQIKIEQTDAENKPETERLKNQITNLKKIQINLKKQQEKIQQQNSKLNDEIQELNSQIQVLTFSYQQNSQQLLQKQKQITEYKQNNQILALQTKQTKQQIERVKQKLKEQNKRTVFLQQLCNKLELQSELNQEQNLRNCTSLNQLMKKNQKEFNKYHIVIESLKKQKEDIEKKVYESSERYTLQIKKRDDQLIILKKQNVALFSESKSLKLERSVSPCKSEVILQSSPDHRLQRLNSAKQFKTQHQLANNKQRQIEKMKRIEKQLNKLISQCISQNQKNKTIFKEKQLKMQETISSQNRKVDDLLIKKGQLQSQLKIKASELTEKEEHIKMVVQKMNSQTLLQERKMGQIDLKVSMLESQNSQLQKKYDQLSFKRKQDNHMECFRKIQIIKIQNQKILDAVLTQITLLADLNNLELNLKSKGLQMSIKQLKTYDEIQKAVQINYAIHNLKQTIRALNRKIKQLSQSTKIQHHYQTLVLPDRQMITINNNQKQTIYRKTTDNIQKHAQETQSAFLKIQQLQRKCQRFIIEQKRKHNEIQELNEEIRKQKRQINRLKTQLELFEDQKQDLKFKLKIYQQKIARNQIQNANFEKYKNEQILRSKQIQFYRSEQQSKQIIQRNRVCSFRSCEKRQNASQQKNYKRRLAEFELSLGNLNRQVNNRQNIITSLERQRAQRFQRQKRIQQKYNKKVGQFEHLQERYQLQLKIKIKLESKIAELQYQLTVLIDQMQQIRMKKTQDVQYNSNTIINLQKQVKSILFQKDSSEKRLKKDMSQKQQRLISMNQQYELKIIDLNSQISKLKQELNQIKINHGFIMSKYDQLLVEMSRKEQKLSQNTLLLEQVKQRLQKQEKQKNSMLTIFGNNTSQLNKILEEKQIQIEELKFMQASTLINLQYAKSKNRNSLNDSTYSFEK